MQLSNKEGSLDLRLIESKSKLVLDALGNSDIILRYQLFPAQARASNGG
jgi:hypothetical protein